VRTFSVTPLALLGLIAVAVSACSTAPAPAPANPAPTLPADSIAYDTLPVRTDRPLPFAGGCSQLAAHRSLLDAMGVDPNDPDNAMALRYPRSGPDKPCDLKTNGGELVIGAEQPKPGRPDPWDSAWNDGSGDHFRRLILLDRYYAASEFYEAITGKGCEISVDTGSPAVLTVIFFDKRFADVDVAADRTQGNTIGQQTCPSVQHVAETLLGGIDPDGGSLAAS
jgi:hypothetical protein